MSKGDPKQSRPGGPAAGEAPRGRWRVGVGNDVHALAPGCDLVVGGVRIPSARGAVGHSDGDALTHAICDALLGAAALGDIGRHFPDSSPEWKGASSLLFLRRVRKLLEDAGYSVGNVDATVGLERPKLAPHMEAMRSNLARTLGITLDRVSVKGKTGEGLDAIGRGEAIRADAVVILEGARDQRAPVAQTRKGGRGGRRLA